MSTENSFEEHKDKALSQDAVMCSIVSMITNRVTELSLEMQEDDSNIFIKTFIDGQLDAMNEVLDFIYSQITKKDIDDVSFLHKCSCIGGSIGSFSGNCTICGCRP